MECAVCGGEVEPIYRGSGICGSCANLLGEMGPSGLEALSRCQKRYASQKELVEKLKTVNHRQAEDVSELDLALTNAIRDRELLEGEVAGLKNVDIPTFQRALEQAKVDKDCCCAGTEVLRVKLNESLLQYREAVETIERARTWSKLDSAGCPLCTYVDGVYTASCAYHREMQAMDRLKNEYERRMMAMCSTSVADCGLPDCGWCNCKHEENKPEKRKCEHCGDTGVCNCVTLDNAVHPCCDCS